MVAHSNESWNTKNENIGSDTETDNTLEDIIDTTDQRLPTWWKKGYKNKNNKKTIKEELAKDYYNIHIYTDGSYDNGKPKRGNISKPTSGWGFTVVNMNKNREIAQAYGGIATDKKTKINSMHTNIAIISLKQ